MPWTPRSAPSHTKKAKSAKQKRRWADIANALYNKGVPEGQAIREANGVLKKEKSK